MNGISKNQIKLVKSLHQKKFREEHGLFIAEGNKVVSEALASGWEIVDVFFCSSDQSLVEATPVNSNEMGRISAMKTPPGLLAVIRKKTFDVKSSEFTLILDGIKDPGNLGTIIRSSSWFGVSSLILTEDCVDCFNPKVVQSTMGALFHVHVAYMKREGVIDFIKQEGLSAYRADMDGQNALTTSYSSPMAVVIGSESHGVSDELRAVSEPITIPRVGFGESLNAANACSILLAKICGS